MNKQTTGFIWEIPVERSSPTHLVNLPSLVQVCPSYPLFLKGFIQASQYIMFFQPVGDNII